MKTDYQRWIDLVVGKCYWRQVKSGWMLRGHTGKADDGEPLVQRCETAAPMMARAFPELTHCVGTYTSSSTRGTPMYHHWLVTFDGEIIDPTHAQFMNFDGTYPTDEKYTED